MLECFVMELRQLAYFVAVAEEGSFTRAAARLHVAQPGVSAQIRLLEQELGQQLLDRSMRNVRLTRVGADVLPYARAALEALADVQLVVDDWSGLMRGRVAVGMITGCSFTLLFDLLAQFHSDHPAVEITLSEDNSDRLIEALIDGTLDLALVGLAAVPEGIAAEMFIDEALVAVVGCDDPLASQQAVTLDDLRGRTLMCLPQGTGVRAAFDHGCTLADIQPRIGFEATDPAALAELACRGLGVAILPKTTANAHADSVHILAIEPELRSSIAFAWRVEGPIAPAGRAIVNHVRAALRPTGA